MCYADHMTTCQCQFSNHSSFRMWPKPVRMRSRNRSVFATLELLWIVRIECEKGIRACLAQHVTDSVSDDATLSRGMSSRLRWCSAHPLRVCLFVHRPAEQSSWNRCFPNWWDHRRQAVLCTSPAPRQSFSWKQPQEDVISTRRSSQVRECPELR